MDGSRRLVEILDKECGCWIGFLRMCGVMRGLINRVSWLLILALAKEVRIEGLADWGARSSK